MHKIILPNGHITCVDLEDVDKISSFKWYAYSQGSARKSYVSTQVGRKRIYLHRLVMDCPAGVLIDHIDGNPLNNQKNNLRFCNNRQNMCNKVYKNKSGFRGVHASRKKWTAQVEAFGDRWTTPSMESAECAARAYDAKAYELFGEFVPLNFPSDQLQPFHGWRQVRGR